jgi:hypothetical protein
MNVTTLLPVASFVLACIFWMALGAFLLTVMPGFQRTLPGVLAFLLGALAGAFVLGKLAAVLFSRPDGEPASIPIMVLRFVIGLAGAIAGGLLVAHLVQRNWPKKTGSATSSQNPPSA